MTINNINNNNANIVINMNINNIHIFISININIIHSDVREDLKVLACGTLEGKGLAGYNHRLPQW